VDVFFVRDLLTLSWLTRVFRFRAAGSILPYKIYIFLYALLTVPVIQCGNLFATSEWQFIACCGREIHMTFASVACSTNELPAAKTTSRHFEPGPWQPVESGGNAVK